MVAVTVRDVVVGNAVKAPGAAARGIAFAPAYLGMQAVKQSREVKELPY